MSATFWNMRRKMRRQLGIEREVKEEKEPVNKAVKPDDHSKSSRKPKASDSAGK